MYDLYRTGGGPGLHCMLRVGSEFLGDLDMNLGHKLAHSATALSLAYLFGHLTGD